MDINEDNEIVGTRPPVRYIKLGRNNAWTERAFRDGEIPFGFREVPHELALTKDEARIASHLMGQGKSAGAATSAARQICTFYSLGEDAIWITFADGMMWWAQADPEVLWLGESDDYAPRLRKTKWGWANSNRFDVPFYMNGLSSRLTRVAGTQQTLCRIEAEDYALRKIWNREEPAVRRARQAKAGMLEAIVELVGDLHWADFETLVDLLLSRSGWHRVSSLGGTMKDADMVVEQTVTKETAFVQVKSSSSQSELDRYIDIFDKNAEYSRMIFACHSPAGKLTTERANVMIWAKAELAEMILRDGLFDWLVERTA